MEFQLKWLWKYVLNRLLNGGLFSASMLQNICIHIWTGSIISPIYITAYIASFIFWNWMKRVDLPSRSVVWSDKLCIFVTRASFIVWLPKWIHLFYGIFSATSLNLPVSQNPTSGWCFLGQNWLLICIHIHDWFHLFICLSLAKYKIQATIICKNIAAHVSIFLLKI